jgi:hypothetical protein
VCRLFKQRLTILGLTPQEAVVLIGGGHSLGQMHADRSGFTGAWTSAPTVLSNEYFTTVTSLTSQTAHGSDLYARDRNVRCV